LPDAHTSDAINVNDSPLSILLSSILAVTPRGAPCIEPHATLNDLKKLEILCYVPALAAEVCAQF
jgi:hypothetical protein